jgi:hypothetical protein
MIYRLVGDVRPVDTEQPMEEKEISSSPERLTAAEAADQESVRKELSQQDVREATAISDRIAETARRLARSIVSDISLYRQAEMEEGIRTGTLNSLLAAEINDGRILYESKVPEAIRKTSGFFDEALDEFIQQKKKELNIT